MNKHLKQFLLKGLIYGGFGPIVLGIVFLVLEISNVDISLNGYDIFIAIISTYIMAFVNAGSSQFHKIENFSTQKTILLQFLLIYVVYVSSYIINNWIPFKLDAVIIFTFIFIVGYFIICLIIYAINKKEINKLNGKIKS